MENLRVSYIQSDIDWENKERNLEKYALEIGKLTGTTDLILLPEMFPTGFSMTPEKLFELPQGNVIEWMHKQSQLTNAVVAGSLIVKDGEEFFNRFYFAFPDGKSSFYDKRHLFRMANEHKHYSAGEKHVVIEINGWRIRPLVCYDLRFPVWSRNRSDYDVLVFVANWPAKRKMHWETLLRARAIENQAFCIGVNRIGRDDNEIDYSGDSLIFDPFGDVLSSETHLVSKTELIELEWSSIDRLRKGFPAALDADSFRLI